MLPCGAVGLSLMAWGLGLGLWPREPVNHGATWKCPFAELSPFGVRSARLGWIGGGRMSGGSTAS